MILGVCTWLNKITGIETKIIRLLFVLSIIFGIGILAYPILFIVKQLDIIKN